MKNEKKDKNDFLELGKTEYDLRDLERQQFGKMYAFMLQTSLHSWHSGTDNSKIKYLSVIRVLAQYLKHYMTEEDLVEKARQTEKDAEKALDELKNSINVQDIQVGEGVPIGNDVNPAKLQDNIEELRHEAGLKLPQESKDDPETVGVDQL